LRARTLGCRKAQLARMLAGVFVVAAVSGPPAGAAASSSGGVGVPTPLPGSSGGAPVEDVPPVPVPGAIARLAKDGRTAMPPAAAPEPVKQAIYAANRITRKPYQYGGGHRSFTSRGYDCSGSVSYALHGGGLLPTPLHSSALLGWGEPGRGQWITVYTNSGHAYVVIAGLRFDTSGPGESGPRWRTTARSSRSYVARHPEGF
jgi:cobalamin biosynthesis Mg chelatase CobN